MMRAQDWALLGIEPTADIVAIKKAYAVRLRVTKPDDDPDSYQRLREAFERAKQLASRREEGGQIELAVPSSPPSPQGDAPTVCSPQPEPQSQLVSAELLGQLELAWRRDGEAGALVAWGSVRTQLETEPLNRHAEFSSAFANWVLSHAGLPDSLICAISEHFAWQSDFRSAHALGAALEHALRQALPNQSPRSRADPELLQRAEPLRTIARLSIVGSGWRAIAWALLIGPVLMRWKQSLAAEGLLALGIDPEHQRALERMFERVAALRFLLWMLALTPFALLDLRAIGPAADLVFKSSVASAVFLTGTFLLSRLLRSSFDPRRDEAPWHQSVIRWRARQGSGAVGIGLIAMATGIAALQPFGATFGPGDAGRADLIRLPDILLIASLALPGIFLTWPKARDRSWVVAGLVMPAMLLSHWSLKHVLGNAAALGVGACILMLAATALEQRVLGPRRLVPMLMWRFGPFSTAERWDVPFALTPVLMAGLARFAFTTSNWTALFVWIAGSLSMYALRSCAEDWGLHRLSLVRVSEADQA